MPITTPINLVKLYDDDSEHFRHVLQYLFEPATSRAGFTIIQPMVTNSDVIQAEIIRNLQSADLVLCDISSLNANVFFELGIRVALDLPVALVRDTRTPQVPFDNSPVSCHQYDARLDHWVTDMEVPKLAAFLTEAGKQTRNALWRYFGATRQTRETEPGDPLGAKLDILLAGMESIQARPRTTIARLGASYARTTHSYTSGARQLRSRLTASE